MAATSECRAHHAILDLERFGGRVPKEDRNTKHGRFHFYAMAGKLNNIKILILLYKACLLA